VPHIIVHLNIITLSVTRFQLQIKALDDQKHTAAHEMLILITTLVFVKHVFDHHHPLYTDIHRYRLCGPLIKYYFSSRSRCKILPRHFTNSIVRCSTTPFTVQK